MLLLNIQLSYCIYNRILILIGSLNASLSCTWHMIMCTLRYHGRWILTKNGKKIEITILQKIERKSFFIFKDRREKLFLNLLNPPTVH